MLELRLVGARVPIVPGQRQSPAALLESMPQLPLVSILFITYKRVDLLKRSLNSFMQNTDYPNLELVVTDDGSPIGMQCEIQKLPFDKVCLSPRNRGLGANTNAGLRSCEGKYVLQLQDDWECCGPAEYLRLAVDLMEAHPEVGLIKFYGVPHAVEPPLQIPDAVGECYWISNNAGMQALAQSVYSDGPHLKSRTFCDYLGAYKESCRMEECELDYAARFADQVHFRAVYFPYFYNRTFSHVGEAVSFRTGSRLRRVERKLAPYAQVLKRRHLAAYKLTKTAFNVSVRALFSLSILRH